MIILDTNALIYLIKGRIDIKKFVDEEMAVPSSAVKELDKLSSSNADAKLALSLLNDFKILQVDENGDDGIMEAAMRYGGSVITNDRLLGKRLKEKNVRVTTITKGGVRRL